MGIPERDEEIDPEKRAELQRRLEELRSELESLARDRMRWPDGAPLHLQDVRGSPCPGEEWCDFRESLSLIVRHPGRHDGPGITVGS